MNQKINLCLTVVLISCFVIGDIDFAFAKNSIQDGTWDFDYVGILVSDTTPEVGQTTEINIPLINTGTESGSVLTSITLIDSLGNNYYGETKIYDIPPNTVNYPQAKFDFTPQFAGPYSINSTWESNYLTSSK